MKKTIKLLSIIVIVLLLTITTLFTITALDSTDPYNSTYTMSVSREVESQAIERFKAALANKQTTVSLSDLNCSVSDGDNLFSSFLYDNPKYSFMYTTGYGKSWSGNTLSSIELVQRYNYSDYASMLAEIESEIDNICLRIDSNWSDLQKVLWVNDYICDVYEYDFSLACYDLYSMVHYRLGTCQGYTKLFKAVMDKLGIECSFSSSKQIEHVWNIVKINGQWYHIDVTWNDNPNTKGYILLTNDTTSYKEHGDYFDLPPVSDAIQKYACTDTKYNNYFWVNGFASGFAMFENNTAYGFDLTGNFNKYNLNNNTYETKFTVSNQKWPTSSATNPSYYVDYFGDVISMGDVIYYSTPRQVYLYDRSNDKSTLVFNTDQIYIYAVLFDGTNVYLVDYDYNLNTHANEQPLHVMIYKTDIPLPSSKYTVKWVNDDNTVLETDENVTFGTTPTYNGSTPTKAGTAEYSYTFAGWTPTVSSVTGDVTYKATFTQTQNKYTVTWKNYDGSTIKTEQVEYGKTPSYSGATPTKPSDTQYSYQFSGWSPSISSVTGDVSYTAQFTQSAVKYTVTWKNYNGNILKTDTNLNYGDTPVYTGATPTRPSTAEYTYTFTGWTPSISSVTGNATYEAVFSATKNQYTITWKNFDGTVLKVDTLEYGSTPVYSGTTPTRASDSKYEYNFKGWSPNIAAVSKNASYTATFTATMIQNVTTEESTTETTSAESTTETTIEVTTTETTTEVTTSETTTEITTEVTTVESTTETTTEEVTTETTKETTESTSIETTTEETTEYIGTVETVPVETTATTEKETTETTEVVTTNDETEQTTTEGIVETETDVITESNDETDVITTTKEDETSTEKVTTSKDTVTTKDGFSGFIDDYIEKLKSGDVVYIAITAGAGVVVLGVIVLILKAIFKKKK